MLLTELHLILMDMSKYIINIVILKKALILQIIMASLDSTFDDVNGIPERQKAKGLQYRRQLLQDNEGKDVYSLGV